MMMGKDLGILTVNSHKAEDIPLECAATSCTLTMSVAASPPLQDTNGVRSSLDSERSSSPSPAKGLNGHADEHDLADMDPVERLQAQLERTRQEKDALAAQYNHLLAKLTTMRTTLGNKLKQDAVRSPSVYTNKAQRYDLGFA